MPVVLNQTKSDYPFGMVMPGRNWTAASAEGYRFGFNGQEYDSDIIEGPYLYSAKSWEYDSRTGRRWNLEPLAKDFPCLSPYVTYMNSPIITYDWDGREVKPANQTTQVEVTNALISIFGNNLNAFFTYSAPSPANPGAGSTYNGQSFGVWTTNLTMKQFKRNLRANNIGLFQRDEAKAWFRVISSPDIIEIGTFNVNSSQQGDNLNIASGGNTTNIAYVTQNQQVGNLINNIALIDQTISPTQPINQPQMAVADAQKTQLLDNSIGSDSRTFPEPGYNPPNQRFRGFVAVRVNDANTNNTRQLNRAIKKVDQQVR